jgi:hypothetical protein
LACPKYSIDSEESTARLMPGAIHAEREAAGREACASGPGLLRACGPRNDGRVRIGINRHCEDPERSEGDEAIQAPGRCKPNRQKRLCESPESVYLGNANSEGVPGRETAPGFSMAQDGTLVSPRRHGCVRIRSDRDVRICPCYFLVFIKRPRCGAHRRGSVRPAGPCFFPVLYREAGTAPLV